MSRTPLFCILTATSSKTLSTALTEIVHGSVQNIEVGHEQFVVIVQLQNTEHLSGGADMVRSLGGEPLTAHLRTHETFSMKGNATRPSIKKLSVSVPCRLQKSCPSFSHVSQIQSDTSPRRSWRTDEAESFSWEDDSRSARKVVLPFCSPHPNFLFL